MKYLKDYWLVLTIVVFIVTSSIKVYTTFETKEGAEKQHSLILSKVSELEKRVEASEKKSENFSSILCATAIELNWPTVKKACGIIN